MDDSSRENEKRKGNDGHYHEPLTRFERNSVVLQICAFLLQVCTFAAALWVAYIYRGQWNTMEETLRTQREPLVLLEEAPYSENPDRPAYGSQYDCIFKNYGSDVAIDVSCVVEAGNRGTIRNDIGPIAPGERRLCPLPIIKEEMKGVCARCGIQYTDRFGRARGTDQMVLAPSFWIGPTERCSDKRNRVF